MKFLLPLFGLSSVLTLSGCVAAAKYDIDVRCKDVRDTIDADSSSIRDFNCDSPDQFSIKCVQTTIQRLNGDYLCSTYDKKSVRIRVVQ